MARELEVDPRGTSLLDLLELAQRYHPSAAAVAFEPSKLEQVSVPAILILKDAHCVVYCGSDDSGRVAIFEPTDRQIRYVSALGLSKSWEGKSIVFADDDNGWIGYAVVSSVVVALAMLVLACRIAFRMRNRDKLNRASAMTDA